MSRVLVLLAVFVGFVGPAEGLERLPAILHLHSDLGRMYAVQREREAELVLTDFSARAGATTAVTGETLRAREATLIEVSTAVAATGGPSRDIPVTLVRNGAVVGAWTGPAPIRVVHREAFDGSPTFYRLDEASL